MKLLPSLTAALGTLLAVSGTGANVSAEDSPPSFQAKVKPLIEEYCIDCHDAETKKAGLRLDNLAADFRDSKTGAVWIHVFDKLASGEMPPKKKEQPPEGELRAAEEFLRAQLHDASLERQQKEGRVTVRRLNGTEYENTLRDLLGTRVALKEMLPEDNTTAGFDNVSSGLDLSATHFLRYQEAAAKAVASVVPINPPIPFSDTRTGLEMTKKGPNFREGLGRNCKLVGDALVFYSTLPRYGLCSTASVPTAGRYKITMSACAVGAAQKPIPVGLMTVEQSGREGPVLREVRDIPPGEPAVIEFEFDLARHQSFVVNLLTTWDIRRFKKPIEEYDGPGVKVEWMKVEGPIDAFPPPSY
jgi:uncharacterized protein DUF1587/cytochrome c